MTSQKPNGPTLEELDKALDWTEDTLSRAQVPFFLLGETLRSVCEDNQVNGEKIEVGVLRKYLTKSCLGLLDLLVPGSKIEDGYIRFDKDGVPIEIKVIERRFKVFERPNFLFHRVGEYKIPNPLEKYWKQRYFVR